MNIKVENNFEGVTHTWMAIVQNLGRFHTFQKAKLKISRYLQVPQAFKNSHVRVTQKINYFLLLSTKRAKYQIRW